MNASHARTDMAIILPYCICSIRADRPTHHDEGEEGPLARDGACLLELVELAIAKEAERAPEAQAGQEGGEGVGLEVTDHACHGSVVVDAAKEVWSGSGGDARPQHA
jgi:hypothetical protein